MSEAEPLKSAQAPQRSPTQILEDQYSVLRAMYVDLTEQNEQLLAALDTSGRTKGPLMCVKVEDVNMPFMALVGLMVKVTLASIPAALILTVVFFCMWSFLLGLGLGFGS